MKTLRYLAISAFAVNGALLLGAGLLGVPGFAEGEAPPAKDAAKAETSSPDDLLADSLKQMATDLKSRATALGEREEKAADQERRLTSLAARLGVDPNFIAEPAKAEAAAAPGPTAATGAAGSALPPASEMFKRLLASYENMEPENAASALRRLFAIDRDAVVELVSGMAARKAGGVLDALASTDPAMTADLSHELWLRGKTGAPKGGK
ncbi:MAG: hypothetical protein HY049_04795 [Acidobacteria bacterium]|nr:hypothetical protein [Acidobacteriota bacterium]